MYLKKKQKKKQKCTYKEETKMYLKKMYLKKKQKCT